MRTLSPILVLSLFIAPLALFPGQPDPGSEYRIFPLASIPESREISNAGKATPADLSPEAVRETDIDTAAVNKPASHTNTAAPNDPSDIKPSWDYLLAFYLQLGNSAVPDSFDSSINLFLGMRWYLLAPQGGGVYFDFSAGVRGSPAGKDRMETDLGFGFAIGKRSLMLTLGFYASLCYALEDYGDYVEEWDNPGHYTYERQSKFLKAAAGIDLGLAINMVPETAVTEKPHFIGLMIDVRINLGPYPGDLGQKDYKDVSWSVGFGFGY